MSEAVYSEVILASKFVDFREKTQRDCELVNSLNHSALVCLH